MATSPAVAPVPPAGSSHGAPRDPRSLGRPSAVWVFGLALLMGAGVAVLSLGGSGPEAALLPLALVACVAIVQRPFLGTFLIAALVQQGLLTRRIVESVPASFVDVVGGLTLLGVIVGGYGRRRAARFPLDGPGPRLAIGFLLLAFVSSIYANRMGSLSQIQSLAKGVGILLLVVWTVTDERKLRWIVLAVILSTAVSTAVSLSDYGLGTDFGRFGAGYGEDAVGQLKQERATTAGLQAAERRAGTANMSATASSHMMASGAVMAASLALFLPWMRLVTAGTMLLGAAGTIVSFSRSGALALGVGGLVVLGMLAREKRLGIALLVLIVGAGGAIAYTPELLTDRFESAVEDPEGDETLQSRLAMSRIGLELFARSPLIGIGPDNFKWESREFAYRFEQWGGRGKHLHNMYLSVLVETGVVGFVLFGSLLVTAVAGLWRLTRRPRDREASILANTILAGLLALLVACAFQPSERYNFTWLLLGTSLAALPVLRTVPRQSPSDSDGGGFAARR